MPGTISKSLKRLIHSGSYSVSKAAEKAGLEPEEPIIEGLGTKTKNSIEKKAKAKPTLKRSKSAQLGGRRRRTRKHRTRKHKSRKHRTRKY